MNTMEMLARGLKHPRTREGHAGLPIEKIEVIVVPGLEYARLLPKVETYFETSSVVSTLNSS